MSNSLYTTHPGTRLRRKKLPHRGKLNWTDFQGKLRVPPLKLAKSKEANGNFEQCTKVGHKEVKEAKGPKVNSFGNNDYFLERRYGSCRYPLESHKFGRYNCYALLSTPNMRIF